MSDGQTGSSQSPVIRELIERLELIPHPEGGWYRETWRSGVVLKQAALPGGYPDDRVVMTSILFLLPTGMRSRRHRVRSEELWLHHQGDDLRLVFRERRNDAGDTSGEIRLGQDSEARLQAVVPPGDWQQVEALPGPFGYVLVGCVVAPGFEFADFEMDSQGALGSR